MSNEKPYRYPGTRPFTENERELFFGRDEDIGQLQQQIRLEQLIVLFGKSGLGKSSLLNAGVLPLLGESNKFLPLPVRIGLPAQDGKPENKLNPSDIFLSKLVPLVDLQNLLLDRMLPDLQDTWKDSANDLSFWLACKSLQLQHKSKTLLLVFDQFEELFLHSETDISRFAQLVATLLYGQMPQTLQDRIYKMLDADENCYSPEEIDFLFEKVNIKVVISIRSDKMSLLNRMKTHIPHVLQKTYELKPLRVEQAKEALLKPASSKGEFISSLFKFDEEASKEIINYLSADQKESIETFQLQLICQYCENLIINSNNLKSTINVGDLGDLGDLSTIFIRHYENLICQIPEDWQHDVKVLIEDKLIIGDIRVPLPDKFIEEWFINIRLKEKQIKQKNASEIQQITNEILMITNEILLNLVNSRLLRCEPNTTEGLSYELSHDTLVEPITTSAKVRKNQDEIQELNEKQLKARKRLFFVMLAFVIALALAGIAVWQMCEAKKQKKIADTQKDIAEEQKQTAFKLFKQEMEGKGIKVENLFMYFFEEAESKYEKGLYDEAIRDYNRALLMAETPEQKLKAKDRLLEIDILQKHLKQAGELNSQQDYAGAINKYQEILNKNQTDSVTIFRKEFVQMLFNGYIIKVPGGTFIMGDNNSEWSEVKPEHPVKLDTFYMAKYEVTQGLYKGVMGINPSRFNDNLQNPVEQVSWFDAVEFCNRLSELMGLKPFYSIKTNENAGGYSNNYTVTLIDSANGFRLPTEAEWEYAGGWSKTGRNRWAGTSDESELKRYANYENDRTIPVDSLQPNPVGLFHMSGNVWEWCWDLYDSDYYKECDSLGIIENPFGPQTGEYRVLRGGSLYNYAGRCRLANRYDFDPVDGWYGIGFRLVFAFQFTSEPGQAGKIMSE